MNSHSLFDLICNRPEGASAYRFDESDETDEAFNQRQQRCDKTNKDNALLNAKSEAVKKELTERRWAMMYLQHLLNRVKRADRVMIEFSDLPSITDLSLHDPKSSSSISSPLLMYKTSVKQHSEVLEQRKRDAHIGTEISWTSLKILALKLTSGKSDLLYLYKSSYTNI